MTQFYPSIIKNALVLRVAARSSCEFSDAPEKAQGIRLRHNSGWKRLCDKRRAAPRRISSRAIPNYDCLVLHGGGGSPVCRRRIGFRADGRRAPSQMFHSTVRSDTASTSFLSRVSSVHEGKAGLAVSAESVQFIRQVEVFRCGVPCGLGAHAGRRMWEPCV